MPATNALCPGEYNSFGGLRRGTPRMLSTGTMGHWLETLVLLLVWLERPFIWMAPARSFPCRPRHPLMLDILAPGCLSKAGLLLVQSLWNTPLPLSNGILLLVGDAIWASDSSGPASLTRPGMITSCHRLAAINRGCFAARGVDLRPKHRDGRALLQRSLP